MLFFYLCVFCPAFSTWPCLFPFPPSVLSFFLSSDSIILAKTFMRDGGKGIGHEKCNFIMRKQKRESPRNFTDYPEEN